MKNADRATASQGPRRHRRLAQEPAPPIIERPDGYYWIGDGALGEFGPFETYELARSDREAGSEETLNPHDYLVDAERETGLPVSTESGVDPGDREDSEPHLHEE